MSTRPCKACGAQIIWIKTPAGTAIPCNINPVYYVRTRYSNTRVVLPNGEREAVAVLASNIVNTKAAEYSDDGTTQQATIRTGIVTKGDALVPNPVTLIPYRTFLEVEQPASDFIFRISEGRSGEPLFKLVAADGGIWKAQAVQNVKAYLVEQLADIPDRAKITIIA